MYLAKVVSISYGEPENPLLDNLSVNFNTQALSMGLQGITITVSSSGDEVSSLWTRLTPELCGFFPSFPASSPYMTVVGATQGPESGFPEVACSSGTGLCFSQSHRSWL